MTTTVVPAPPQSTVESTPSSPTNGTNASETSTSAATSLPTGAVRQSVVNVRCSGQHWDDALSKDYTGVERSVRSDIALIFATPEEDVEIRQLSVGSLVVEARVVHHRTEPADDIFQNITFSNAAASYKTYGDDPITLLGFEVKDEETRPPAVRSWLDTCGTACIVVFACCASVLVLAVVAAFVFVYLRSRKSTRTKVDVLSFHASVLGPDLRQPSKGARKQQQPRERKRVLLQVLSFSENANGEPELGLDDISEDCNPIRKVRFDLANNVFVPGRSIDREWPADSFFVPEPSHDAPHSSSETPSEEGDEDMVNTALSVNAITFMEQATCDILCGGDNRATMAFPSYSLSLPPLLRTVEIGANQPVNEMP
jgi:hypothetical protein